MTVDRVHVGEVIELQRRPVGLELESEYREVGVRSFGRGMFHKEPVTGAEIGAKRVFRIEPGDLVISNVFAWEGAVAVAGPAEDGMIGSHRFMTFTPKDERVDILWLSWFLRSEIGLGLLREASPGSAGRNRTLAVERFEALQIPLPPIEEQRRVACYLSRIESFSNELAGKSARAKALAEAISAAAVTAVRGSDGGQRSAGERDVRLAEILQLRVEAVDVQPERSYDIAGVYSFGRGMFSRGRIDGVQTSYKTLSRLRSGQVVMSRLKAWEGALSIVPPDLDGHHLSPEFPTFDVDEEQVEAEFLRAVLSAPGFWNRLRSSSTGIGARRERVHAATLLDQVVGLPGRDEQRKIAVMLSALRSLNGPRRQAEARVKAVLPAALNEAFAGLS